jgi:hypothetical protein
MKFHSKPPKILGKKHKPGRVKTLCRQTSEEFIKLIEGSNHMICGKKGMLGAGIYFSNTIEDTNRKASQKGIVLQADVIVGRQLIVQGVHPYMNHDFLKKENCDSLKRRYYFTGPEYVVFDPE